MERLKQLKHTIMNKHIFKIKLNRPYTIFFSTMVFASASILILQIIGCSNSNNSSAPPDPSLTYEVVSKNPAKFNGKRVRWYGQFGGGGSYTKKGMGSIFEDVIFVDPNTDFGGRIHAFSANGESEKDQFSLMFDLMGKTFWVTGTLDGTSKIKMKGGGSQFSEEMEMPVLLDAQFELSPESAVKK